MIKAIVLIVALLMLGCTEKLVRVMPYEKEYFAQEIQKKKVSQSKDKNFRVSQNHDTQKVLYDSYQDIFSGLEAYPDFINQLKMLTEQ